MRVKSSRMARGLANAPQWPGGGGGGGGWAQVELTDAFCVEFCHVLSRFHLRERIHDPDSVFRIALKD